MHQSRRVALQWSRGCEAAEADMARGAILDHGTVLQWSRGCEAAEARVA